jgi:hypothetical protein
MIMMRIVTGIVEYQVEKPQSIHHEEGDLMNMAMLKAGLQVNGAKEGLGSALTGQLIRHHHGQTVA